MDKINANRLRFVKAREAMELVLFLDNLGVPVQMYGAPVWTGDSWYLWFVASDGQEISSVEIS